MLENGGFRPVVAGDGKTGRMESFVAPPAPILAGLRMPGLSGIAVCKRIRAAGAPVPIVVLGAIGEEMDRVLPLETGAGDYVVKPCGTRELPARIRAALRRTLPGAQAAVPFAGVDVELERRTEDLSQTNVEAEHKLPVTPAGMPLFNAFLNGRRNGGSFNPATAAARVSGCGCREWGPGRSAPHRRYQAGAEAASNS
jgi:DNA-binding response OmpR family regulator